MHMDSPMVTYSKNDGIISLMHCQEWNILCSFFHSNVFFAIQEILTVKLHARSIEPMIPKSALTQSKNFFSSFWLHPLKPKVKS